VSNSRVRQQPLSKQAMARAGIRISSLYEQIPKAVHVSLEAISQMKSQDTL
jgi:hypothetical protein